MQEGAPTVENPPHTLDPDQILGLRPQVVKPYLSSRPFSIVSVKLTGRQPNLEVSAHHHQHSLQS